jgi:hypothetical protein
MASKLSPERAGQNGDSQNGHTVVDKDLLRESRVQCRGFPTLFDVITPISDLLARRLRSDDDRADGRAEGSDEKRLAAMAVPKKKRIRPHDPPGDRAPRQVRESVSLSVSSFKSGLEVRCKHSTVAVAGSHRRSVEKKTPALAGVFPRLRG